jgi:hypothetical protein
MRSMRYVFVTIAVTGGGYEFLMCPCNTDVLDALTGYNINCGDTNVPFPRRLLLERRVWHSSFPLFSTLTLIDVAVAQRTRKTPAE